MVSGISSLSFLFPQEKVRFGMFPQQQAVNQYEEDAKRYQETLSGVEEKRRANNKARQESQCRRREDFRNKWQPGKYQYIFKNPQPFPESNPPGSNYRRYTPSSPLRDELPPAPIIALESSCDDFDRFPDLLRALLRQPPALCVRGVNPPQRQKVISS